MKPTNRIHSLTRWPVDPHARRDMARTDIAFVRALHCCGIDVGSHAALMRLERTACKQAQAALQQLKSED